VASLRMKTIITVQVLFYTDFNMVMMLSNDLTNSICKVNNKIHFESCTLQVRNTQYSIFKSLNFT
jgi:hypothetical protein